ncbi:MAG TPA: thioesterase [Acidobacteria bacterium]|nr:thioesterase [Acidobacteriota bacterium]
MLQPFLMKLFYLAKLPLAFVAGLRLTELDERRAAVTVPYGWRTTNPFRSTYFAALAMAAELSTGALAMLQTDLAPRPVALLIVGLTAGFEKKATGTTTFVCEQGDLLADAVARTVATGEPATATVETIGRSADGTVVARFTFTWSFKARAAKG